MEINNVLNKRTINEGDMGLFNNYIDDALDYQIIELNSTRYKDAKEFLNKYDNINNSEYEHKLLKMINMSHLSNDRDELLIIFRELKSFIMDLPKDKVDSSIILKTTKELLQLSFIDCESIITNLINIDDENALEQQFVTINLSKNRMDTIREKLPLSCYIYSNKSKDNSIAIYPSFVTEPLTRNIKLLDNTSTLIGIINVLDDNHINVYQRYNEIIELIHIITNSIYNMQMNYLLSTLNRNIKNNYTSLRIDNKEKNITIGLVIGINKKNKNLLLKK